MAAASDLWQKKAVLCGYPITPASDLLHYTAQWEALANISCLQAEDEIAAAGMALGVSYGGHIGICCTSGPGMDLKAEMIGLGVMAEVPLIIIDVQRAGPSTGMPTKAQQSDLLMALFGRHGSCPVPVLAQCSPEDGVATMLKAVAWSQKASTPVIVLSDALMASATTALKVAALPALSEESSYTSPGPQTARRTLTGLETNIERTEISYEPDNHQKKVGLRRQKIEDLSEKVLHPPEATILLLSYGSTSMALKDYLLANRRWSLAHLELTMLYPLPSNFWDILAAYQTVVAVDLSDEQLGQYLKSYQRRPIISYGQVHGHQFLTEAFDNWLEIQPWCQIITGASSHG
jgi:2-oxoglutarate ferredoxin oxidoreductase subunit alpha